MSKANRRAELIAKIRDMASSGQYKKPRSIETHLKPQYPEVHTVMQEAFMPREIELVCQGKSIFDA